MKDTAAFHPAPTWLTTEYLEKVFQAYKKDKGVKIIDLEIKPATVKGENYVSIMTRIKVTYQLSNKNVEQGSYIVKSSQESDPFIAKIFSSYHVPETEMIIYEKVLPKLMELLHEIGDKTKLFADTVYVDYKHKAFIFEDLAVYNFTIGDRLVGMTFENAKLSLEKLAKMHAAGAVYNERNLGFLEQFQRGLYSRHSSYISGFFANMLLECANCAEQIPELGAYYKEKLIALQPYMNELSLKCFDERKDRFLTLNHGDFWVNNIMIRLDKTNEEKNAQDQIKDILLIDFQYSAWASPATDLHYFFNTSLQNDVRYKREDELVQFYYSVLRKTLIALKYSGYIPSLHEFYIQVEQCRFYALASALGAQAIMINEETEDADFEALMLDNPRARNFRKTVYRNKVLHEHIKKLLPYWDRKGLLDVLQ